MTREGFEVLANVRPDGVQDQIEIDLAIRYKNQVGIAEVKSGDRHPKRGLDQLAMAGSREYLGTYTEKFLFTANAPIKIRKLADSRQITIIELPFNQDVGQLDPTDAARLCTTVREKLCGKSLKVTA